MPFIKFVNEAKCGLTDEEHYDDEQGLLNLLAYIFRPSKTQEDLFRVDTLYGYSCSGCEPFSIFPKEYEQDPEAVFEYMCFNNHAFGIMGGDLARHRCISFDAASDYLPADLDSLGRRICVFYRNQGYIAAYGVHADTKNLHIHIAVDTISFWNGNRFSISFEKNSLFNIVQNWEIEVYSMLLCDEQRREQREEMLYGKPRYGMIPLTAAEQIQLAKNRKKYQN